MLTLYMLRHGQTDFNRQGIVQGGGIDSDLNDEGLAQGQAFYQHYKHIAFDAAYVSGLKRTAQTLADFEKAGYTLHKHPELNELSWGWLEGRKPDELTNQTFFEIVGQWRSGNLDARLEGGESAAEVWQRAKPFFEQLPKRHAAGCNILICTHGRTLRILLSELLGYGGTRMEEFLHSNTSVNILRMNQHGACFAEVLNNTDHLANQRAFV